MKTFSQYLENKKISYSAVLLDQQSHEKLLQLLREKIPEGWKTYAHHMTINMGSLKNPEDLGKLVEISATEVGISDMAMAVKVNGYPSKNAIPHITIAINIANGGKPVMSNNITNWEPIPLIKLQGTITEVPY